MPDRTFWLLSQLVTVLVGTLLMSFCGWLYGKKTDPDNAKDYVVLAAGGAFVSGMLYTLLRF